MSRWTTYEIQCDGPILHAHAMQVQESCKDDLAKCLHVLRADVHMHAQLFPECKGVLPVTRNGEPFDLREGPTDDRLPA